MGADGVRVGLDIKRAKSVLASYRGHFKHSNSRGRAAQIARRVNVCLRVPAKASLEEILAKIEMDIQ
jgi:hypothetical protein